MKRRRGGVVVESMLLGIVIKEGRSERRDTGCDGKNV